MSENDLDTVFSDDWSEDHRSGVVAVVGRPNVGKSTLINCILGQKVAIVSPKPQTTRRQQLGIYTQKDGQILFVDTPGIHKAQHKLGEYMVEMAQRALRDADIILWVIDATEPPNAADRQIAQTLSDLRIPPTVVLALNKADALPGMGGIHKATEEHRVLVDHDAYWLVSALDGTNVPELVADLRARLPLGPRYYPADQVSEVNMRFIAAEIVRERIIFNTEQEIPYSVAVEIEGYKERSAEMTYISAVIYVERDTQKGIIIGKHGAMIKQLGAEARAELEAILGTQVYLELHVKVLKGWREDEKLMARLGYRLPREKD